MSDRLSTPSASEIVQALVARARTAQGLYQRYTQEQVDEVVTAAGWAIMKPENNRVLADLAVTDSGLGNAQDKFDKNYRKTLAVEPADFAAPGAKGQGPPEAVKHNLGMLPIVLILAVVATGIVIGLLAG